jgi:hypothetical protein
MRILTKLKHEFQEVLPPTIFFLFAFNIIALTKALMLKAHGIQPVEFAAATLGALVVGNQNLTIDIDSY